MSISRRTFLKSTAATAAITAAGGPLTEAAAKSKAGIQPGPGNKWPGRVVVNFNEEAVSESGSANEDIIKKLQLAREDIDVFFITYWDFLNVEARKIIDAYIQPKNIAIMHIPTEEADKITNDIRKLEKEYPNVTIFRKNMANRIF